MKPIPYLLKQDPTTLKPIELTIVLRGRPRVITCDHPNFAEIVFALNNNDFDKIEQLVDVVRSLLAPSPLTKSNIEFSGVTGQLTYQGYPVAQIFVDRALNMYRGGMTQPLQHFLCFLENLYQNPNSSVVQRLYQFLERGNMPTTDDGCFLAYKKVTADMKDIYTRTIDNSVGAVCKMPRVFVNDDDSKTCEAGLHFCSYEYLKHYGKDLANTVVIVKVNPRDVVSIPVDYDDTKGRCCEYTVVEHLVDYSSPVLDASNTAVVFTAPLKQADTITIDTNTGAITLQSRTSTTAPDVERNLLSLTNSRLTKLYNKLEFTYGRGESHKDIDHVRSKASGVAKIIRGFTSEQIIEEMKYV